MARPRLVGSLLLALVVAACAGTPSSPTSTPAPTVAPSPSPSVAPTAAPTTDASGALDAKIDVGGGRMTHILCRGEAKPRVPTLWLENGLDGSLHNWASVRGPLQQLTRVCGWDRPGNGDSDPPPAAGRTVEDLVDDLEATIAGAGIEGPFVIASHSAGPWVSTVFTARHPDDVVGLVFVDPRGPHVTADHEAALPAPSTTEDPAISDVRGFFDDGGFDDNAEQVPFAPSEAIVAALLDADGPLFGDRPVIVLGAERTIDQFPPLPEPYLAEWWRIWQDGQRAYAAESTQGSFEEVRGSGHLMMDDRPRAVIDAITAVLEATTTP